MPSGVPVRLRISLPVFYMRKKKIKINKLDYINPEEVLIRFQDKRNLIFFDLKLDINLFILANFFEFK